ncbi:type II toxin-antitoxin system RelE family toxin [Lysobacter terrae]
MFAFVAPEAFFKAGPKSREDFDALSAKLSLVLEDQELQLSSSILERLRETASDGERSVTYFGVPVDLSNILNAFWDEHIPPSLHYDLRVARAALEEQEPRQRILFSRGEPDWYVGFSIEFLKSIARADGKLRGRILDAIGKISSAPMDVVGDTVKPLTANLSGMWRYRLGDDRLVYLPDHSTKRITLLYFGARGDIYSRVSGLRP